MITTILLSVFCTIIGFVIGALFVRIRSTRQIATMESELEFERLARKNTCSSLEAVQIKLEQTSSLLYSEQQLKVRFETQVIGLEQQLSSRNEELKQMKGDIETKVQDNIIAQNARTKAETELKDAVDTITALDNDIKTYKIEAARLHDQITDLSSSNAELSAKYKESLNAIEDQKRFVVDANSALREAFNSLSAEALSNNNKSFLDLAKTSLETHINESKSDLDKRQQAIGSLVKPLSETLEKFDVKIQAIEKAREGAYSEIKVFLGTMNQTADKLHKETNTLVTALKTSQVRGKYGEIGLKRLVEFAGMNDFCDYTEQESTTTEEGKLRPDMIVNLPGGRRIIIDAKVPLLAYMQAFETTDENEKRAHLAKHGAAVREHLRLLSNKSYWQQFSGSVDYVVLYLQIESSFGAALEIDRTLIEDGIRSQVIFATPTTLITLLRTAAFSWQQDKITENVMEIRNTGVELYSRVSTLIGHMAAVGNNISSATQNYNKMVGSLESRFIPQVRKLKEIGGSLMKNEIVTVKQLEVLPKELDSTFLTET